MRSPEPVDSVEIIPETIAGMRQFGLSVIAPGHCTGWRAVTPSRTRSVSTR